MVLRKHLTPILGPLLINPCPDGCPPGDLTAAMLSQNQMRKPLLSLTSDARAAASSTAPSSPSIVISLTLGGTSRAPDSVKTSLSPVRRNLTRTIVGWVAGSSQKSHELKGSDSTGARDDNAYLGIRSASCSETLKPPSRPGAASGYNTLLSEL